MTTFDIPQLIPKPSTAPRLTSPELRPRNGDQSDLHEMTASKKVDDISRHESKHDSAPKHEPKPNAREKSDANKPGFGQPQGGKPLPGSVKK